jgi:predicted enzyme related to lactoylglutathione lyase
MADGPEWRAGKICYAELPAADVAVSAEFYRSVFGWRIRQRGDGSTAFDDTTGAVSGSFVTGRPAVGEPGLLLYVMVADVAEALDTIVAAGGRVVRTSPPGAREVFGWFADPAGNVLGVYEQRGLQPSKSR